MVDLNGYARENAWLTWAFRGLLALLSLIIIGLQTWSLNDQVDQGRINVRQDIRLDIHDAELANFQRWRDSFRVQR
ncbi:MAG TPA: hypothetical protein VFA91_04900 [Candidatus Polarisedimenticolia bacterium]|nr:hypothetical protein [Candidatus Polarisedimenticolia bacterium]